MKGTRLLVNENLLSLLDAKGGFGALWATESEDLDCTFVSWQGGKGVSPHMNAEVDVLMIVMEGKGQVLVDNTVTELEPGRVVLVPKGRERSVVAGDQGLAYLNVHKRRKRLMPGDLAARPRP